MTTTGAMTNANGALILLPGHDDDPAAFEAPAAAIAPAGWQVRIPLAPAELGHGRAWFESDDDGTPDLAQVRASLALLDATIAEVADRGVPAERIALVGYSQGAAIALLWALRAHVPTGDRTPTTVGALAAIAGWLPSFDGIEVDIERCRANRVLVGHGADDDVVPLPAGRSVARLLERHAIPTTFVELEVGHDLEPFLVTLAGWLTPS